MDLERLLEIKAEMDERERSVMQNHKQELTILRAVIKNISINLSYACEHEYVRDNHAYAPLYCKHCYLLKEQIMSYVRRHQPIDNLPEKIQALMGDI